MAQWIKRFTGSSGAQISYVELEDVDLFCQCGAKILAYDALLGYLGSNVSFFCNPDDLSKGHEPERKV
jgi:hypothetical protein